MAFDTVRPIKAILQSDGEVILAEFTDEFGQVKQQRLEGMTARCYLHELDHMNGVRFVEHVGDASVQVAKRKAEKFIKTFVRAKKATK